MSRSCQSATFSSPTSACAAHDAREPADPLGDDRVALVRHRRRALLAACRTAPATSRDLGAREVADLERELLERRGDERERGEQLGVPVALRGSASRSAPARARAARRRPARPRGRSPRRCRPRRRACRRASPSSARASRSRSRSSSKAQPASLRPKVVGSAWTPCVRPMHQRRPGAPRARATTAASARSSPSRISAPGVADLQRERGVDDVRGGQAVVEPAARPAPSSLGDGVDERGEVVVGRRARSRRRARGVGGVPQSRIAATASAGTTPSSAQAVERGELDLEPARELALVRPDPGHRGAGVARDHRSESRASAGGGRDRFSSRHVPSPTRAPDQAPSRSPGGWGWDGSGSAGWPADSRSRAGQLRAARAAAFFALSTPTVATGTPGGICTIESSASSPSRTLIRERNGTPITGRSVCAATTPGSAAARPAPAISTRDPSFPRPACVLGHRVRVAVRGANLELVRDPPRLKLVEGGLHPLAVGLRADEDPDDRRLRCGHDPRLPRGRCRGGTACPAKAIRLDRLVRGRRAPRRGRRRRAVTSRMRPPFVTSRPSRARGAGVEDVRAGRLRVLDAPRSACRCLRAPGSRPLASTTVTAAPSAMPQVDAFELAGRCRRERAEQVAFDPRQDRLRLRVAEAAVELEHARAVVGEHQPGVEQAR